MSNMGYCRFRNTLSDLEDCIEHIDYPDELSDEEKEARLKLIKLAKGIAEDFGDEV